MILASSVWESAFQSNLITMSRGDSYTNEDPDYKSAYEVFCKGLYICADATRVFGLVLDCMGWVIAEAMRMRTDGRTNGVSLLWMARKDGRMEWEGRDCRLW